MVVLVAFYVSFGWGKPSPTDSFLLPYNSVATSDDISAIRLPMLGTADSLNVSVTAAVIFYEALRQRSI